MADKKKKQTITGVGKHSSRKAITLAEKMEVLKRIERGERTADIVRALGLNEATIRTIRRNADKIKASVQSVAASTTKKITRMRNPLTENMEKLLAIWIDDQNQRHVPLNMNVIVAKAKSIFEDLKAKGGEGTAEIKFTGSHGWFSRFKARNRLHHIKITGEAASGDQLAAQAYPETLKKIIADGQYCADQVFNVDETGLFWKRMPNSTFISMEEAVAPGFKVAKDRLTLLLGGNASGDLKLKPMLVYRAETPHALRGFSKPHLPVIWKSNKKAWVTKALFQEWFTLHFCPAVKEYLKSKNLSQKALLLLDNAPGHPIVLEDHVDNAVQVIFLPPNTTALLQPMDQGIIATFKAYYLNKTMEQLLRETDVIEEDASASRPSIREFWKGYNIMKAIRNISASWDTVSQKTMNGCWKRLWPECVQIADFEGFDVVREVQREIVAQSQQAGFLDVGLEEVENLLASHRNSLTNEELQELAEHSAKSQQDEDEFVLPRSLTTKILKENLRKIDECLQVFEDNDPNSERSSLVIRSVNEAISCYYELYQQKKAAAQQSILSFFTPVVKPTATAISGSEASTSRTVDPNVEMVNLSSDDDM